MVAHKGRKISYFIIFIKASLRLMRGGNYDIQLGTMQRSLDGSLFYPCTVLMLRTACGGAWQRMCRWFNKKPLALSKLSKASKTIMDHSVPRCFCSLHYNLRWVMGQDSWYTPNWRKLAIMFKRTNLDELILCDVVEWQFSPAARPIKDSLHTRTVIPDLRTVTSIPWTVWR